jgi:uncharacterized membrane protein
MPAESLSILERNSVARDMPISLLGDMMVITCLTVVGAWLRLASLGGLPLWFDEATLWQIAQSGSVGTVLTGNAHGNSAPPLFALLTHLVLYFGNTPTTLRLIPALCGIVAIPTAYILSRSLWPNRLAALTVAGFMALAPQQLHYSQQIREYSLTVLLTEFVLLLSKLIVDSPSVGRISALVVIEVVSICTQYGLALVLAVAVPWTAIVLWRSGYRQSTFILVGGQFVALFTVALVYRSTLHFQISGNGFKSETYLREAYWSDHSLQSLVDLAVGHTYGLVSFSIVPGRIPTLISILFASIGMLVVIREHYRQLLIVLMVAPFFLTFLLALTRLYPYTSARQDIYLTVPILLLVAWGLVSLLTRCLTSLVHNPSPLQLSWFAFMLLLTAALSYSILQDANSYLLVGGGESEFITAPLAVMAHEQRVGDHVYVAFDAIPAYLYYTCRSTSCPSAFLATGWNRVLNGSTVGARVGPVTIGGAPRAVAPDDRYLATQVIATVNEHHRVWFLFSHTSDTARSHILALSSRWGHVRLREQVQGASLYLFTPSAGKG